MTKFWPMSCKGKFCVGIPGRLLKCADPLERAYFVFPLFILSVD